MQRSLNRTDFMWIKNVKNEDKIVQFKNSMALGIQNDNLPFI